MTAPTSQIDVESEIERSVAALEAAAQSWVGTPFCEGKPVKGAGVNCQNCVAEIYFEAGWLPRFEVPQGPRDWARSQSRSLMVEAIEACGHFAEVWRTNPELRTQNPEPQIAAGDLLGFRVGHCIHHLAIALERGRIVHAVAGHGVIVAPCIPDVWLKRLERVWRIRSLGSISELRSPNSDLPSPISEPRPAQS